MLPFYLSSFALNSYWLLGCLCVFFFVRWGIKNKETNSTLFLFIALVFIILMRLPTVFLDQELDVDESQVLAHAITLMQDPVYWRAADGCTIGPLDSYFLAIFGIFGGGIGYKLAHTASLVCALLSLFFFYQTVQIFCNKATSHFILLAPILFLIFAQGFQFTHYTSEQFPIVLLNLSLWLSAIIYTNNQTKWWVYAILGFTLTAIPFAKLQVSLLAFFIGLAVVVLSFYRKKYVSISILIGGTLCFLLPTLALHLYFDVFDDFWEFYIVGNLFYTSNNEMENIVIHFFRLVYRNDLMIYAFTIVFFLLPRFRNIKGPFDLQLFLFALLWLLIGIYSVSITGRLYIHYLNLLIYPSALFLLVAIKDIPMANVSSWSYGAAVIIWGSFLILKPDAKPSLDYFVPNSVQVAIKEKVSSKILEYTSPQDRLTVWGWACNYYVETQLAQGTAESLSVWCIDPSPLKSQHQARYLSDITKNRPAVFVDAVAPGQLNMNNPETASYENFSLLKDFIDANYKLVDTIDGVRIFVLQDQLKK
jgi:hypothetical protein